MIHEDIQKFTVLNSEYQQWKGHQKERWCCKMTEVFHQYSTTLFVVDVKGYTRIEVSIQK